MQANRPVQENSVPSDHFIHLRHLPNSNQSAPAAPPPLHGSLSIHPQNPNCTEKRSGFPLSIATEPCTAASPRSCDLHERGRPSAYQPPRSGLPSRLGLPLISRNYVHSLTAQSSISISFIPREPEFDMPPSKLNGFRYEI